MRLDGLILYLIIEILINTINCTLTVIGDHPFTRYIEVIMDVSITM